MTMVVEIEEIATELENKTIDNRELIRNKPVSSEKCVVCYSKISEECKWYIPAYEDPCGHHHCEECLARIVCDSVLISCRFAIDCAQCKAEFHPDQIRNVLLNFPDNTVLDCWERYSIIHGLNQLVKASTYDRNPYTILQCPKCTWICLSSKLFDMMCGPVIQCQLCSLSFCTLCHRDHQGKICPSNEDSSIISCDTNASSKSCPGCGIALTKQNGCSSVKCPSCKAKFCWLCLLPDDENHLKCSNKFESTRTQRLVKICTPTLVYENKYRRKFLLWIFMLLASPVLAPLILLIAVALALEEYSRDEIHEGRKIPKFLAPKQKDKDCVFYILLVMKFLFYSLIFCLLFPLALFPVILWLIFWPCCFGELEGVLGEYLLYDTCDAVVDMISNIRSDLLS